MDITFDGRTQNWLNTGLRVRRGEQLHVTAAGNIRFASRVPFSNGFIRDPDGRDERQQIQRADPGWPAAGLIRNSLVLRVSGGAPFQGGTNQLINIPADGVLELSNNDNDASDNADAWSVSLKGPVQRQIDAYHAELRGHGHDMSRFHADWHRNNPDPAPPPAGRVQPDYGMNVRFGGDFLQMHHEMVRAADTERKTFMQHQSIESWFRARRLPLPPLWTPGQPIPGALAFYPADPRLQRENNNPAPLLLPRFFTRQGIGANEQPHPYTGARRLSDFRNLNQLGCCILPYHNLWHSYIGGAMRSTFSAIDDPVFYFGVHWVVEQVFLEYRSLPREGTRAAVAAHGPEEREATAEERAFAEQAADISRQLREASAQD